MRLGDIRQELESYGINTKTFLEKKEMVTALEKARAEGKKPIPKKESNNETKPKSGDKKDEKKASTGDRKARIAEEMEKAKAMKVGELKEALQNMNVSTKSMFEKTEFVKAYAEAMVDGVKKSSAGTANNKRQEEPYDPEYRDVVIQKMSRGDPRLMQGGVIDVTAR